MTQFLKKLRAWLAKLAFWRKRPDEAVPQSEAAPEAEAELKPRAAADAAEPTPETPVAKLGVLARLKRIFTFRRREIEATADTVEESKPATAEAREPKKRIRATETPEPEVPEILETQPNLFTRLKQWLSFRSKAVETAAEPSPEDAVEKPPKKKTRTRDEPEEPEVPEPKPSFFTRLKQWLSFRSKAVETEVEPDTEDVVEKPPKKKIRATDEPEEPEVPEPKPSFFARLRRWISFRRKPAETEIESEANDKTLIIEKTRGRSEPAAAEGEAEAPPPSRLKRLLIRLRSKWVWIPALSLAGVGLVSWVVVVMMHTTHEKERLQAELKAAKKMLEKKSVATVMVPAPPPLSAPAQPEKKIDPAFQIVGHVPAPQPEEASGIDASDCVVKDRESVAENLKNCITSFNQAVASTPNKPKKP